MTDAHTALLLQEFKALSACFDLNPRSIQRAGRNTLIKDGHTMWVISIGRFLSTNCVCGYGENREWIVQRHCDPISRPDDVAGGERSCA